MGHTIPLLHQGAKIGNVPAPLVDIDECRRDIREPLELDLSTPDGHTLHCTLAIRFVDFQPLTDRRVSTVCRPALITGSSLTNFHFNAAGQLTHIDCRPAA